MQTHSRKTRAFRLAALLLLLAVSVPALTKQTSSTPTQEQKEFNDNVKKYVALHKKAVGTVPSIPKGVTDPEIATKHQQQVADAIRLLRPNAKRGEILTPMASRMIIAILKQTLQGQNGANARQAILGDGNPKAEEAPVAVNLTVNASYPAGAPLSTVPPSVLLALPTLPKELEFRFVGNILILRDTNANIIVDILPNAL